jgi:hypothetical protein
LKEKISEAEKNTTELEKKLVVKVNEIGAIVNFDQVPNSRDVLTFSYFMLFILFFIRKQIMKLLLKKEGKIIRNIPMLIL